MYFTGNVAANKPGSLPPDSERDGYSEMNHPRFAVDEITSRISSEYSCTFILISSPWLRLDLQQIYTIYGVLFITCTDKCCKITLGKILKNLHLKGTQFICIYFNKMKSKYMIVLCSDQQPQSIV